MRIYTTTYVKDIYVLYLHIHLHQGHLEVCKRGSVSQLISISNVTELIQLALHCLEYLADPSNESINAAS